MKLEDQLRAAIRKLHYSHRTEEAYVLWYQQFVRFHELKHPETMGAAEVGAFLTHLAVNRNVSASTQNQALNALVFLYRQVLKTELENIQAQRARTSRHLPVVLAAEEVRVLLKSMDGVDALQAGMLYGCGLRVMELLRLRIKDVDLAGGKIEVRDGKGAKDRVVALPASAVPDLRRQLRTGGTASCAGSGIGPPACVAA